MTDAASAGNATAEQLILAGIDLFGQHGFKATTTRMIAEAANSNIGSISYYFGNKHGLYLAAARHIASRMREQFQLDAMGITYDHARTLQRDEARELLEDLVRSMVRLFVREDEARRWLMLVMREQANPTEAFDILYRESFEIVHITITTLIATLMRLKPTSERVILETHTLVGQIVFFLVGRTPILRRLGSGDRFTPETADLVEKVIISHLDVFDRH